MTDGNLTDFQQRMFDQLNELESIDRQRVVESFIELGRKAGVDVLSEILNNGRSVCEVFDAIAKSQRHA